MTPEILGGYLAAVLIIFTWSFVIKETDLFRFAEHTLLGTALGYSVLMGIKSIKEVGIDPISTGSYQYIIPMLLGILLLMRFSTKLAFLSRYATAWIIGVGVGVFMRGVIHAQFLQQIAASVMAPYTINSIIIIIFTICVPIYFFFTRLPPRYSKLLRSLSTIGRYALMIGFGATFGNTVMYRINLAVGNLIQILRTLGVI